MAGVSIPKCFHGLLGRRALAQLPEPELALLAGPRSRFWAIAQNMTASITVLALRSLQEMTDSELRWERKMFESAQSAHA